MTTLYERIKEASNVRKMSIDEVNDKAGLSNKAIYGWKKSTPKADNLQKVADVLNVSVDFLLGRTDEMSTIRSEEQDDIVLKAFDGKPIDDEDREKILEYARFIMSQKKGK
ncbi:Transcriptional regulator [Fructobacillus cardui]|uniref:helix-turn-helix domain-containing protein n=1 Tax=Fructobacillus cardui TaxID=2893170 RepID=UPI002D892BC5|nr:Transcriptional regulator [Fructobacillus cardui]CAK1241853.1 Transcriptional regulator [Fructobacillus cardui]